MALLDNDVLLGLIFLIIAVLRARVLVHLLGFLAQSLGLLLLFLCLNELVDLEKLDGAPFVSCSLLQFLFFFLLLFDGIMIQCFQVFFKIAIFFGDQFRHVIVLGLSDGRVSIGRQIFCVSGV